MAKVNNLEGEYLKEGSQLKKGDLVLHIGERKKPTPTKTRLFLRAIKPQFDYISSLYLLGENRYQIDYSGKKYLVIVSDSTAQIESI